MAAELVKNIVHQRRVIGFALTACLVKHGFGRSKINIFDFKLGAAAVPGVAGSMAAFDCHHAVGGEVKPFVVKSLAGYERLMLVIIPYAIYINSHSISYPTCNCILVKLTCASLTNAAGTNSTYSLSCVALASAKSH
jgi:hypothetical protein